MQDVGEGVFEVSDGAVCGSFPCWFLPSLLLVVWGFGGLRVRGHMADGRWGAGISNLMAPDEMRNLGFGEEEGGARGQGIPGHAGGATKLRVRDDGKKIS